MHSHDEAGMPAPLPENPLTPPQKKRRWWLRFLIAVVLVGVMAMMASLWLTRTEAGLRFTLFRIPAWFGVEVEADKVSGTVWNGFEGDKWVIKADGVNINLNHLKLDWASRALFERNIHIHRLDVGEMHIETTDTAPKKQQNDAKFPESLRLPANVSLDEVNIHKITFGPQHSVILNQAQFSYHYQQGQQHILNIHKLDSTFGVADGVMTLGESKPFATTAKLDVLGHRDGITVKGGLNVNGDLDTMLVKGVFKGEGILLDIDGKLHPLAATLNHKFTHFKAVGKGLNPQTIIPTLPKADIQLDVDVAPVAGTDTVQGQVHIQNAHPLHVDANGIPVKDLEAQFKLTSKGEMVIDSARIQAIHQGQITVAGVVDVAQSVLNLDVGVSQLRLNDVMNNPLQGALSGTIQIGGGFATPQADWHLSTERLRSSGRFNLAVNPDNGQQSLHISKAYIATPDGGAVGVAGEMSLSKEKAFKMAALSRSFNPAALSADYPQGNVNLDARVVGSLTDSPVVKALLDLGDSTLSGAKLSGKGDVVLQNQHLSRANVNVVLDGNRIQTDGSIGKVGDKLNLDINAPRLDQFGFGLSGLLTAKGHVAGDVKKLDIQLTGQAQGLRFQDAVAVQQARFNVTASPVMNAPLKIDVSGNALKFGTTAIDQVNVNVAGTGNNHNLKADGSLRLDGKPYRLNLASQGGLNEQMQWKGNVSTLDIAGAFNARLNNRMALEAGAQKVALSSASWGLMGGSLNLNHFVWEAGKGLQTKGSASGLDIRQINNLVQVPIEQNVIIGGDWDVQYGQNMNGFVRLQRQSGDITLPHRHQKLGLSRLQTDTRFSNGSINTQIDIATTYARANGQINIGQNYGSVFANAPLSGTVKVVADDLATVRNFLPVGMEVTGRAQADVRLGGSIGKPQLSGPFTGSNLSFLDRSSGVYLKNGSLQSGFSGQSWVIEALTFREGAGSATVNGRVNLLGSDPDVNLKLILNRFEVLSKPTQQVTLSGQADLTYLPAKGLGLDGNLKVDRARFDVPKSSAPALSDDVVVIEANGQRRSTQEKSAQTPIHLNLLIDLNRAFRFNGQGLDVLLDGQLRLQAVPGQDVNANGQIKSVYGRYKSYGQDLIIKRGYITFTESLSNPTLNVRAERRASPVGAGVEVTGSLSNPHTALVANEPMSDKDKLSWLILGRASNSDSDDAAIAAAAGAWLAGGINDKLGMVDNIGLESRRVRDTETGEMNAAEQVLNVSKRLTNQLSVGYEYGLSSAESSVKLIYYISRSLQMIGRVGSYSSGGEIRYSKRFDGFSKETKASRQAYEEAHKRPVK